jgi:hypothetical protein
MTTLTSLDTPTSNCYAENLEVLAGSRLPSMAGLWSGLTAISREREDKQKEN